MNEEQLTHEQTQDLFTRKAIGQANTGCGSFDTPTVVSLASKLPYATPESFAMGRHHNGNWIVILRQDNDAANDMRFSSAILIHALYHAIVWMLDNGRTLNNND